MARLQGRKILITGGGSGIGRATAILFAHEGASVAILDRNAAGAAAVAAECNGVAIPVDVSDPASVAAAVAHAEKELGGIDGLVNAAGIFHDDGIKTSTAELFARTLAINVTGTFLMIQAVAPRIMASGKGTIVNIGSGVGLTPTGPGSTAYVASKGGVIAMSKAIAMELAPHIRVNVVCPGAVDTPMTAGHIRSANGDYNPAISRRYALGRPGQPPELAAAILFLTSDESSFVTGVALPVDGGRTFH